MAQVSHAIAGALGLGALLCAWRAWWLFGSCLPAPAHVEASTYTDRDRERNGPYFYGWCTRGRSGVRLIRDTVRFEDVAGQEQTARVSRWVSREYAPFTTYVVWYDPSRSEHVTANGPGYWLGFGALLLVALLGLEVIDARTADAPHIRVAVALSGGGRGAFSPEPCGPSAPTSPEPACRR